MADSTNGKRVRCQKCGQTFAASSDTAPTPATQAFDDLFDPLGSDPLSATMPASQPKPTGLRRIYSAHNAGASNPSGGPTDTQMRLVCGGMLALGIVLAVGSFALQAAQGTVYLAVIVLIPLTFTLGIAGVISPNVVRAVGKYGGHLPGHYKVIGWGVMGISFLFMILLMIGFFLVGFQPVRPGNVNRTPGLNRSQTATVKQRIADSYEKSPDKSVVRSVSFPIFSINGSNPQSTAERVLGPLPGYVAGSFRISPDQKTLSFQYKGDKDIAIQYALLLPGPTGIFVTFTPEFAE